MKILNTIKKLTKDFYAILKSIRYIKYMNSIPYSDGHVEIHLLANGPSLNQSLSEINFKEEFPRKDYGCVNSFSSTFFYEKIKPAHYFLFDPAYWDDDSSEDAKESVKETYDAIFHKTAWPLKLYIPKSARFSKKLINLKNNENISVIYCNNSQVNASKKLKYILYKNNLAMVQVQNVLVGAIFLSINMGYKKIFIHGADHSWIENIALNENNVVCMRDTHFYDNGPAVLKPWLNNKNSTFRMDEILQALAAMFSGYWILSDYAKKMGAKIINASKKTYIDAFDRL